MSLGYASRLSYRKDLGGQLGAPELNETEEALEDKIRKLASMVCQFRSLSNARLGTDVDREEPEDCRVHWSRYINFQRYSRLQVPERVPC